MSCRFEQLEWLDKKYHGCVIGYKGRTINKIRETSGAIVNIDKFERCTITGTDEQIEVARNLIIQVVSSANNNNRAPRNVSNNRNFHSQQSDENINECNNDWEVVEFVSPENFGRIIGKGGSNIRSLQQKYHVRLRIDRDLNKLVMKGDFPETEEALQGLRDFIKSNQEEKRRNPSSRGSASVGEKEWEEVTFFQREFFGLIIGRQGAVLKKLQEDYDLQIRIERDKQIIRLKGDVENKYKFNVYLCNVMINSQKKGNFGFKKDFVIGVSEDAEVTLKQCESTSLRTLSIPGAAHTKKTYNNIQGLKEVLLENFKTLKQNVDDKPGAKCEVVLHTGKVYSKEDEGNFAIGEIFNNRRGKNLVYFQLTPGDLDLDKMDINNKRESYRYDISICATEPVAKFRYKIFLEHNQDEELQFISWQQAGERGNELSKMKAGPGYFVLESNRVARLDIVDPINSYTSRLNIQYYTPTENYNQMLQHHFEILQEPFFDMIKIKGEKSSWEVQFPELPKGYFTSFQRRAVRNSYCFSGNKLTTSMENIFVSNDTVKHHSTGNEIIDAFFIDDCVDELLQKPDWNPEEIVDKLEKTLGFSDMMMQYLQ